MATLDERFLRPHSRTVLWWAQRETCRTCAHYRPELGAGGETLERCAHGRNSGGRDGSACIEMRDPGAACGPDGLLYSEGPTV